MPEGDTIHRAARALHAALAGQRVERFDSVFAHLTRVDAVHTNAAKKSPPRRPIACRLASACPSQRRRSG